MQVLKSMWAILFHWRLGTKGSIILGKFFERIIRVRFNSLRDSYLKNNYIIIIIS